MQHVGYSAIATDLSGLMRLRFFRYLAGIVMLIVISLLLFRQSDQLGALLRLDVNALLILLLLSVFILGVLALQFRFMVWVFGLHLPFREWFGLTAVNSMFSYYLPARAGLFVRGAYLKKKYGFPVADYTALVISTQLISLVVGGLVGTALVSAYGAESGRYYSLLLVVFAGVTAVGLLVYLIVPGITAIPCKYIWLRDFLRRVKGGFAVWQGHSSGLVIFSSFNLLIVTLRAFRLQLCFYALGIPVDFPEVLIMQLLLSVAFVVSITPGNLGVQEGLIVLCAGFLGVTKDIALAASLLDRAVTVSVIIIAGMASSRMLLSGTGLSRPGVTGG